MLWYTGVLLGAERFMASWHKSLEGASKLREVNRAVKALLANQKTKTKTKERKERKRGGGGGRGERGKTLKRRCFFSFFYFAALIYLHIGLLCS